MNIQSSKCIFSQWQEIPATDKFAKSERVFCQTDGLGVWLTSRTLDLYKVPLLEPCSMNATIARIAGAKGFYLFELSALSVTPLSRPNSSKDKA